MSRQLTCAVDVLETWGQIHQPFLHVDVSVALVFMVPMVAEASVPVHVSSLLTRAPSSAFASISSRHWDADVDGFMVWEEIFIYLETITGWMDKNKLLK